MAITNSTRANFAISLDNGATWIDLPHPNDLVVTDPSGEEIRLDGTENPSMFYDVVLAYQKLRYATFQNIFTSNWSPSKQKILLNSKSGKFPGNPATGAAGSGWVYAPAIWPKPPFLQKSGSAGVVADNVQILFRRYEWDGVL